MISHLHDEKCNGVDDDCDGEVDEPGAGGCTICYEDLDGDGWGVAAFSQCVCSPVGFCTASAPGDCGPEQDGIYPGAPEMCDGWDNDCDGWLDEGFPDIDGDSVADCVDADNDGDGIEDLLDNCPIFSNPAQADSDADGVGDACDACPADPFNDADGDLICGNADNCPLEANVAQDDEDADGLGDVCDPCPDDLINDPDADFVCGGQDNCPFEWNPLQEDDDADFLGNLCDACPLDPLNDEDGDGLCAPEDNCPATPNPDQGDADDDGTGDLCDLPDAPTGLSASAGDGKVSLAWNPPESDGGNPITSYRVYRGVSPDSQGFLSAVQGAAFEDDNVQNWSTQYYSVSAVTAAGEGPLCKPVFAQPKKDIGLNEIWGAEDGTLFVVGDSGTVLRYDGEAWQIADTPTSSPFLGIWGTGPTDVWAVGGKYVGHYDGVEWTFEYQGYYYSLHDVWGSAPGNYVAANSHYSGWDFLHFAGGVWTGKSAPGYNYYSVGACSADEIWGSGSNGLVVYAGSQWSLSVLDMWATSYSLRALNCAVDKMYAVGESGAIRRLEQEKWVEESSPTIHHLNEVVDGGEHGVFAVGDAGTVLRRKNGLWYVVSVEIESDLNGAWYTPPGILWVVGQHGEILPMDFGAACKDDGEKNLQETGIDCGGWCGLCPAGQGCIDRYDCESEVCTDFFCQEPSCEDEVLNGNETDMDCGGSCPACAAGENCLSADDCAYFCVAGKCSVPDLHAVWAESADNVMAAGSKGVVTRWNGAVWSWTSLDEEIILRALGGTTGDDVWTVGEGKAAHYDGEKWTDALTPPGVLNDVWIGSAEASFLGASTGVYKFDGLVWQTFLAPLNVTAVDGCSPDDVWFATTESGSKLRRYHDGDWEVLSTPAATIPADVACRSDGLAVVTTNGALLEYDGNFWREADLSGLAEAGSIEAVAWHETLGAFVVGKAGRLLRGLEGHWQLVPLNTDSDLNAVHVAPDGTVVVAGRNVAVELVSLAGDCPQDGEMNGVETDVDCGAWCGPCALGQVCSKDRDCGSNSCVEGICVESCQDGWFNGDETDVDCGGPECSKCGHEKNCLVDADCSWKCRNGSCLSAEFSGVWGSSNTNVYAVGSYGTILRWDGSSWSVVGWAVDDDTQFTDVWGTGPADVWAAAEDKLVHFDGETWTQAALPVQEHSIAAVWGAALDDYFAGDGPGILRWNGSAWSKSGDEPGGDIRCLHGSASHDVWSAAGLTMAHFDGDAWTSRKCPYPGVELDSVVSLSEAALFSAGDFGRVLRFDGTFWIPEYVGVDGRLNSIVDGGQHGYVAVGEDGIVLRKLSGMWQPVSGIPFHQWEDAWVSPSGVVTLAGVSGNVFRKNLVTNCQVNNEKDGVETDVDCGGYCGPCPVGGACEQGSDCETGSCLGDTCLPSTDYDGVMNGEETDVDCGSATFSKCSTGAACKSDDDCVSDLCWNSVCRERRIIIAALNNGYTGDLGGVAGANALCAKAGNDAGYDVEFSAFLGTSEQSLKSLHTGTSASLPTTNILEQEMHSSWNAMFQSYYGYFSYVSSPIYSFDGKKVAVGTGADPEWLYGCAWTGAAKYGQYYQYHCSGWTTTSGYGGSTDVDSGRMFEYQYTKCDKYQAVLCTAVWPAW